MNKRIYWPDYTQLFTIRYGFVPSHGTFFRNSLTLIFTAFIWLLCSTKLHAQTPTLRVIYDNAKRPIAIEAVGWTTEELAKLASEEPKAIESLSKRLQICILNDAGHLQLPPIAGRYEVQGDAVRLVPQFALRPGMSYRAIFYPSMAATAAAVRRDHIDISIPAPPPPPPTKVAAIYPSASVLPENQLRFYIHFSAPMSSGNAYDHIKLIRGDGKLVTRAFLEIGEELWDGTGTRLTLLFDPGRVKKGLRPREEFGPVLEEGKSYRLIIEKGLRDANNQPLASSFEKRFTAGATIEAAVEAAQWKIEPPATDSKPPLKVSFPRPLDRALLMRMITVVDSAGKPVSGDIAVSGEEREWSFKAEQPWPAGDYNLVIDTALEDSAGNNLARPFEVDVFERVDKQAGPEFVRVPFKVQ